MSHRDLFRRKLACAYPSSAQPGRDSPTRSGARPAAAFWAALILAATSVSAPAFAQTLFTERTEAALIGDVSSESWGTAVGDYNNDGWMDISMLNHRERASIYRNNGDGTLSNVILTTTAGAGLLNDRFEDHHQSVFSDVDGDGDDDLMYVGNSSFEFRRFLSTGRLQRKNLARPARCQSQRYSDAHRLP